LRAAEALAIPTVLVDRPIQVTLRRAWAQNSFWGKMKLLSLLFASVFETEEIPSAYIENLKTSNEMDIMMHELAEYLPAVKTVLVDERDRFLACRIWEAPGKIVLAVLGAGHLPGVRVHLENIANGKETTDTDSLCEVPEKRGIGRLFVYLIPLLIVALIVLGFVFGGRRTGGKMVVSWVLWNGALAAVGTLAALGHPLAVVAAAVTAPITSLTPVVGVGMVTGIVQAFFHKPKVNDLECLQTDAGSFRGWYRNRILRVLLVFLFSSLGSTVGTFLGGAGIIAAVSTFFSDFAAWVAHLFA
ncbi:MAG: TraB family protein, partial [Treponema sp.]|nr:TraB family protein [Treponema sp.]